MRSYNVVVNDCEAPNVRGILPIRSLDTEFGKRNFTFRFDDLAEGLPGLLDPHHLDWLEILGHLHAIDIACDRGPGDVDWNRAITAWLPVRYPDYWTALRPAIESIWMDLTDDELDLRFAQAGDPRPAPRQSKTPFPEHDGVALLSGGQDSFTGALDLMSGGKRLLLLSHTASGATNTAQNLAEQHLRALDPQLVRMKLSARRAQNSVFPGSESSQRSRTFLYVGAACLVAALAGSRRVWLNENGVMALHLPLTAARIGSLSTHTASPPILQRMQELARAVLEVDVVVENQLVRMTKPDVVERAVALGFAQQLQDTVSCWQIGRSRTHCGECVPCLHRRIACETHAVADVAYDADLFEDTSHLRDNRALDNLAHLVAFVQELQEMSDFELEYEYPELLNGGPAVTLREAIDLHRRWADQAAAVLFAHSVPKSIR
jgi:7-cyano-7-deazaguanine synthase in queuosine biosynthesis